NISSCAFPIAIPIPTSLIILKSFKLSPTAITSSIVIFSFLHKVRKPSALFTPFSFTSKFLEVTNSTPMNFEVNEKGVNKAEGLRTLCKKLNITMDEVMAVGDSLNDFKMINEVGIGIAMGNAQEEILEIADY